MMNASDFEIFLDHCPPIIKILPQSPLRFRQSEDFYLTQRIQFNCTEKSSTAPSWTFLSCSPLGLNLAQLNQSGARLKNDVFIPAQTLSFGSYELELSVTTLTSPSLTSKLTIDIEIVPTNTVTRLLSFDIPTIIHYYQQDLLFDPGKYSIDPNTITFESTVSMIYEFLNLIEKTIVILALELYILLSNL